MMAGRSAGVRDFNQLGVLFQFGVVGDLSDGQLVQRFLTARDGADQAAFTALVERHGPMVLAVCRQVLRDAHDAQDAFQATFLVLARRAGSVRKADSVASWLHGVALRIAVRAKVEAARRRAHERRSAAMKATWTADDPGPPESWSALHEEIDRLPGRYREPVVLCYLEGLSTDEAVLRIGCPKGTVLSRLSRARERLRERLARRGLAPCSTLLAADRTPIAPPAPPTPLRDATVAGSLAFAGRRATEAALVSASATPAALAKGLLHAMAISKLTILGTAAVFGAFVMGGLRTFGEFGVLGGIRSPAVVAPEDDARAGLIRSVDKLESKLDETDRRNAEIRKELNDLRGRVRTLRPAPERALAQTIAAPLAGEPSRSVGWRTRSSAIPRGASQEREVGSGYT
jgi:RNA polymerase sigma factor (sigma-70 family)